jgi:hypothetical protein
MHVQVSARLFVGQIYIGFGFAGTRKSGHLGPVRTLPTDLLALSKNRPGPLSDPLFGSFFGCRPARSHYSLVSDRRRGLRQVAHPFAPTTTFEGALPFRVLGERVGVSTVTDSAVATAWAESWATHRIAPTASSYPIDAEGKVTRARLQLRTARRTRAAIDLAIWD